MPSANAQSRFYSILGTRQGWARGECSKYKLELSVYVQKSDDVLYWIHLAQVGLHARAVDMNTLKCIGVLLLHATPPPPS